MEGFGADSMSIDIERVLSGIGAASADTGGSVLAKDDDGADRSAQLSVKGDLILGVVVADRRRQRPSGGPRGAGTALALGGVL